ncbi:MAG TPA: hypothetical protein VFZ78_03895 [Flavisolibacter sp.]
MRYIFLACICFLSCEPYVERNTEDVLGYEPVYADLLAVTQTGVEASRPTTVPGKIYAYGDYLFQVEQNEGIHIIDNSNPQQAHKISFLKVPLCTEISIKSGFLYTNNVNDLVVFNLNNIQSPQLVHRLADAFPVIDQTYPPAQNTYFTCPDPSKGVVVGWEKKIIHQPKCRR